MLMDREQLQHRSEELIEDAHEELALSRRLRARSLRALHRAQELRVLVEQNLKKIRVALKRG